MRTPTPTQPAVRAALWALCLSLLPAALLTAAWGAPAVARAQEPTPSSGPTPTQATSGTVAGTITDSRAASFPDVVVTAGDVRTRSTDDGSYQLGPLPAGDATITFTPPTTRYETVTHTVEVRAGATTYLDVVLPEQTIPLDVVAGENRVATAVAASRRGFPDGADTVVVASAASYPDALAAAPLAARHDAPLLLVDRRTSPAVFGEIARLGARQVIIVGAVAAVPAVVQAELQHAGLVVRRIAGEGRYDTAALIARELGPGPGGQVVVVSGTDFADAMSAGPLAAAANMPILLTAPDRLPVDTADAIAALEVARTVVVGGPAAVSDAVLAQLPSSSRIAGRDRFATSVAVARALVQAYGGDLRTVHVATGRDYPDGLAAAPLAVQERNPLLLVDGLDAHTGASVYDYLTEQLDGIQRGVVFGGDLAVTPLVRARLQRPYLQPEQL